MVIVYDPNVENGQSIKDWLRVFQKELAPYKVAFPYDPDISPEDVHYLATWYLEENPLRRYPNLKAILALSAGVNHLTKLPFLPKEIPLVRMIDPGLTQAMQEYVLSMVLRCHVGHDFYTDLQKQKIWGLDLVDPPLAQKRRVGFLGFGELGQACGRLCQDLGFKVAGWSRSRKYFEGIKSYAGQEELDAFLNNSDILVILLPLTPYTKNMINKGTLAALPKDSFVINVARGPVVVEEDLLEGLDSGHVQHAILDVFRNEPLPEDHPFWEHPKVTVTPHIAALTHPESAVGHLSSAIEAIEKGLTPPGIVDLERGY